MHLAIIISRYKPYIGGAEKQAERMAEAMVKKGWQVTVLTRRWGNLPSYEKSGGVSVQRLPFLAWGMMAPLTFLCTCLWFLWRNRQSIDLIHAHQHDSAFTAALAKIIIGKPVITQFHGGGHDVGSEVNLLARGWKGKLMAPVVIKFTDAFITVSTNIKNDLLMLGIQENICVLPNGVDTEKYSPCPKQNRIPIREMLALPPDTVLFVFSGRLELVKGIDILIQAWENFIQSTYQNAALVILGTGSQEKFLGKDIGNCLFRGAVENVRDYLQAADIFVMPSRYEGTSLAVLEAMACQLPVLLTRVGGNPEFVDHLKNGILIPPENPECLAAWMEFLSDNISLRERLGAKARETVSQRFSFDQVIYDYEEICYRVLTEKNHFKKYIN